MTQLYTDPFGPFWKFDPLKLLLQWNGSIWQFFWIEWLVATAIYSVILSIYWVALRDPQSAGLSDGDDLPILRSLFTALSFITQRFQAALSLMLGFYTTTIYGRWWKVRDVEGVVIGRVNDLAVQIAALVRDEPIKKKHDLQVQRSSYAEEKSDKEPVVANGSSNCQEQKDSTADINVTDPNEVRMNLVRWLNLAHALGVGDVYEKKPNEFSSLESLLDFGLLTRSEYEYMKKTTRSRYQVPFVWFLNVVQELKDRGECGISDGTLIILAENCTRIRGSLADLYMYRNVPVPLSYRQLVNFTVRTYMVIFAVAGALGSQLEDDGNYGGLTTGVFWLILPFTFEYFMFVGWLSLADALGNPFRHWADEFEYENYVRSVALGSNQCIGSSRDACTSVSELNQNKDTMEKKRIETLSKWDSSTACHDEGNIRKILTGF